MAGAVFDASDVSASGAWRGGDAMAGDADRGVGNSTQCRQQRWCLMSQEIPLDVFIEGVRSEVVKASSDCGEKADAEIRELG